MADHTNYPSRGHNHSFGRAYSSPLRPKQLEFRRSNAFLQQIRDKELSFHSLKSSQFHTSHQELPTITKQQDFLNESYAESSPSRRSSPHSQIGQHLTMNKSPSENLNYGNTHAYETQ